jgi:hypothetical protein
MATILLQHITKGHTAFRPSVQTYGAISNTPADIPPMSSLSFTQEQPHMPHDTQQQHFFDDAQRPRILPPNVRGDTPQQQQQHMLHDTQQHFFDGTQRPRIIPPNVRGDTPQQQFLPQQWGHGPSSIADDVNSIAPPPPSTPLRPPTSAANHSATIASGPSAGSVSSKRKQSAYEDGGSARSSEKRRKASAAGSTPVAIAGLTQTLGVFNDSFTRSMSANNSGSSRKYEAAEAARQIQNEAGAVVQRREKHLTFDQLVVFLDLFQSSTPHATTYLSIENEDLRKVWLTAQDTMFEYFDYCFCYYYMSVLLVALYTVRI